MAVVKGFSESQGARMFHLMMIIPAGVLLLLVSLVSLGTMANANKKIKHEFDDLDLGDKCILYTKKEDGAPKFNDGGECEFAVWGGAVLAILAVVLSIVLGVKTFFGVAVFSFLAIIELGMSVLGAVWAFVVAVVITAGLEVTCKSYKDSYKDITDLDNIPCCVVAVISGPDGKDPYFFYEDINASRITTWFAMGLLFCLSILYGIILIMFCCRVGYAKRREGSVGFTELPPEPADE